MVTIGRQPCNQMPCNEQIEQLRAENQQLKFENKQLQDAANVNIGKINEQAEKILKEQKEVQKQNHDLAKKTEKVKGWTDHNRVVMTVLAGGSASAITLTAVALIINTPFITSCAVLGGAAVVGVGAGYWMWKRLA